MKFSHTPTRIYSIAENGALQAEITFPMVSKGVYCINHTFVDDSLRGQGIASALVQVCGADSRNGRASDRHLFLCQGLAAAPSGSIKLQKANSAPPIKGGALFYEFTSRFL